MYCVVTVLRGRVPCELGAAGVGKKEEGEYTKNRDSNAAHEGVEVGVGENRGSPAER